jgi:uncharacterized repeat protein (TIGR03847 family)
MPDQVFDFDQPERFVAGTVGEPGARAFFLQVRDGQRLVSVALEKQQVQLLSERLDAMLDELLRLGHSASIPAVAPSGLADNDPLDTPIEADFRAVGLSIGWDDSDEQVVVEAASYVDEEDDEDDAQPVTDPDEPTALLRVRVAPSVARAFASRAQLLVAAGRPACPFCSLPLDPSGHVCPRANGYRR